MMRREHVFQEKCHPLRARPTPPSSSHLRKAPPPVVVVVVVVDILGVSRVSYNEGSGHDERLAKVVLELATILAVRGPLSLVHL